METLKIREIQEDDLTGLLRLYTQLHDNSMPECDSRLQDLWEQILKDKNHHIIIGTVNDEIVSSCVLIIVLNLTHGQRPYALIENVVTDESQRKKGYASAVIRIAKEIAMRENCYKMMLLTGSKLESTLKFYERAGFNQNDKTGFIQWL